jgi:hypothetical protein
MIRLKSDRSARIFCVRCDSKGRSGYWSCDNLGPESHSRDNAGDLATATGWIVAHNKWYCPECQRDGFVPKPVLKRSGCALRAEAVRTAQVVEVGTSSINQN